MSIREFRNLLGLRGQFVLLVSTVIISSALTLGFYLTNRISTVYQEELSLRGKQLARNLGFNAEIPTLVGATDELGKLAGGVMRDSIVEYVGFFDVDCNPLYEKARNNAGGECLTPGKAGLKGNSTADLVEERTGENSSSSYFVAPILTWEARIDRERLGSLPSDNADDLGEWSIIGQVVVGYNLEPMQTTVQRTRTVAILITLFVVALSIAITTWFMRVIIQPVKALAEVTEEVSRGRLDQKIESASADEIGQLAVSFNRMVDSLRSYKDEVEDYQSTLEEKILERTGELEDAQNQLLQSEKMSAVGQLAAGVAHELNNPLAGILGYSQFALEKLKTRSADQINEKDIQSFMRYLNDIENQARRCKTIVQNLLRFSRSSKDADVTELDLNQTVMETVELMRHQLEMHQISVETAIDETLPLITGNAGKLQQVLTNLLINAMHATPKGGAVRVSTKHSAMLGEFEGAAEIIVEDSGCGIPDEVMGKIFEPFFTTKEIGKGTGLGLSVSYGIIRDHGGEIKVHSETNKGSRFTVILPLQNTFDSSDITNN